MGEYVMVLWPPGAPVPGQSNVAVKQVPEPDIEKLGGKVLGKDANRRLIVLPLAAAAALRRHEAVSYLQRIWMGESLAGWNETYTPSSTTGLHAAPSSDTNLQWGPKDYSYDGSGNIKLIGTDQFTYDPIGRLAQATVDGKTESYQYDPFGNLTQRAVAGANPVSIPVDAASNRMLGPSYDAAGNVISADDGRRTYKYDSLNMLTRVQSSEIGDRRMIYDASDERIGTINVADMLSRWTFRDFEGRVVREFKVDNLAAWTWESDNFYAEGSLIGGETQPWGPNNAYGGRRHYHLDHLGNVRMVTDDHSPARSLSEHEYYPFGTTMTRTYQEQLNWGDPHIDAMRFAGHWRDFLGVLNVDNTEYLDYMHARYYDPNLGRFLSVDPAIDLKQTLPRPQMWNRYAYVVNNPVKYTDPTGKDLEIPATMFVDHNTFGTTVKSAVVTEVPMAGFITAPMWAPPVLLEGGLFLMHNPASVLAAYKLFDAMGGNVGGRINPAGQTGGKLGYLLENRSKSGFFAGVLGFGAKTLDAALRSHFVESFKNGALQADGKLAVTGRIVGANGVVATIKSIWQWNAKTKVWDFITAVPR